MSLLKLRSASRFLNRKHQLFSSSKWFQNEHFFTLSPATNKCLFHSLSRSNYENLFNHSSASPSIIKRNLATANDDNFAQSVMRFFMESPFVEHVEHYILQFHDKTGLHWWSSIFAMTVGIRFILTFPLSVYSNYIYAKVELIEKEMDGVVAKLKEHLRADVLRLGVKPKNMQRYFQYQVKKEWDKLILRDNCHPAKGSIVIFFQIPIWLYMSAALRNLLSAYPANDPAIYIAATEMTMGGPFWCTNLMLPDPTLILPISLSLLNLTIMEIQILRRWTGKETIMRKIGINAFRLISLLTGPIAAQMPAALSLYWVSSSSYGLVQNLALLSPKVRRICGIPHTHLEDAHPYRALVEKSKERWTVKKQQYSEILAALK